MSEGGEFLGPATGAEKQDGAVAFPMKLYSMLERGGEAIGWLPGGDAFQVFSQEKFLELLPQYFMHRKVSSFQRQLNLYGFRRDKEQGSYQHPMFLRNRRDLLSQIRRTVTKTPTSSSSSSSSSASSSATYAKRQYIRIAGSDNDDDSLGLGLGLVDGGDGVLLGDTYLHHRQQHQQQLLLLHQQQHQQQQHFAPNKRHKTQGGGPDNHGRQYQASDNHGRQYQASAATYGAYQESQRQVQVQLQRHLRTHLQEQKAEEGAMSAIFDFDEFLRSEKRSETAHASTGPEPVAVSEGGGTSNASASMSSGSCGGGGGGQSISASPGAPAYTHTHTHTHHAGSAAVGLEMGPSGLVLQRGSNVMRRLAGIALGMGVVDAAGYSTYEASQHQLKKEQGPEKEHVSVSLSSCSCSSSSNGGDSGDGSRSGSSGSATTSDSGSECGFVRSGINGSDDCDGAVGNFDSKSRPGSPGPSAVVRAHHDQLLRQQQEQQQQHQFAKQIERSQGIKFVNHQDQKQRSLQPVWLLPTAGGGAREEFNQWYPHNSVSRVQSVGLLVPDPLPLPPQSRIAPIPVAIEPAAVPTYAFVANQQRLQSPPQPTLSPEDLELLMLLGSTNPEEDAAAAIIFGASGSGSGAY